MKKTVIFGAAGYLGGFVIERLREMHELTLADVAEPRPEFAGLRYLKTDVACYDDVARACEGQDVAVNLVALVRGRHEKPVATFCDVMVKGTWHVAQACVEKAVGRLVNISSVIACGRMPDVAEPWEASQPPSFGAGDLYYCLSKHLGEQVGLAYHQSHGLSVIHLRPGVIDGDGANAGPRAPQSADKPWFVYVDPRDVAQAVDLAIDAEGVKYGTYNIVAGRDDSVFDWLAAAEDLGYAPEHNWPEITRTEQA